jgi:hypothetical protein
MTLVSDRQGCRWIVWWKWFECRAFRVVLVLIVEKTEGGESL